MRAGCIPALPIFQPPVEVEKSSSDEVVMSARADGHMTAVNAATNAGTTRNAMRALMGRNAAPLAHHTQDQGIGLPLIAGGG